MALGGATTFGAIASTGADPTVHTARGASSEDTIVQWPSFQGDETNQGRTPPEHELREEPRLHWQRRIGEIVGAPIASGGRIYVGTGSSVQAISSTTGEELEQYSVAGSVSATPAAVEGTLVVPTADGVVGIDTDAGERLWHHSSVGEAAAVTSANGTAYVGGDGEKLIAVDVDSGETEWEIETDWWISDPPVVANGTVCTFSGNRSIWGIRDGERAWRTTLDGGRRAPPVSVDGTVLVPTSGDELVAVDADSGEIRWQESTSSTSRSAPAAVSGVILVGCGDGTIEAFDLETGETMWSDRLGNGISDPPVVVGSDVLVADFTGSVTAFGAIGGTERWTVNLDGIGAPMVVGASTLIAYDDRVLSVYRTGGSVPARGAIDELETELDEEAIIGGSPGDALRSAIEAFLDGSFVDAERYAESGVETLRDAAEQRESATEAIDQLASALETTDDLVTDDEAALLEAAESAFEDGEYERAESHAHDGIEQLDAARRRADSARNAIEELDDDLATVDELEVQAVRESLQTAESAFENGEYERAELAAEEGLEELAATREAADDAEATLAELREARSESDPSLQAEEAETLAESAESAFEGGEYERANELGQDALDALVETRAARRRADDRLDAAREMDRHAGIDAVADSFSYETALADAERAYDAGDYERAGELAATARRRYWLASFAVDGAVGSSALLAIGYKLRPDVFVRARAKAFQLRSKLGGSDD